MKGQVTRNVRGFKNSQELPRAIRIEDKGKDKQIRQGKREKGGSRKWN